MNPPLPGEGEVHLWRVAVRGAASALEAHRSLLSAEELERARRLRLGPAAERFVVARGSLRRILASYLDADPAALRFTAGPHGKPALACREGTRGLTFNLSHSENLVVVAVATVAVGVDIERIRETIDVERIARRFFSAREVDALLALAPAERVRAFFDCWTRKEAYLKARGVGLFSVPLAGFDVSLEPGEPARLLEVRGRPGDAARWSLAAIDAGAGYAGAVAAEGPVRRAVWQAE